MATIQDVKRELDTVMVRFNGKLWNARVSGRLNKQASISPWQSYHNGKFHTIIGPIYHIEWSEIVESVNSQKPINLDTRLPIDV